MAPPRPTTAAPRTRRDRCPGVLRPWPATDGALVRVRLIGGRLPSQALSALSEVAGRYGDGDVHLTGRANLQLRGLPLATHGDVGPRLPPEVLDAIAATGLLPHPAHDLVRNVMVSPLTGRRGGRADLRPVASELDRLLCADPGLADLPGRFLFVLDDGRGDLLDRALDLGAVALDADHAQLRVGSSGWGAGVALADVASSLIALARRFLEVRGTGHDPAAAAWHVDELASPLAPLGERHPDTLLHTPALPFDDEHVPVPGGVLDPELVARLTAHGGELVVTPWHGMLRPEGVRP